MSNAVEDRIRDLAKPLWQSAARPYGMATDFWLMAEQMVLEMVSATARMQVSAARQPPPFVANWLPEAAPVARIQELAKCMWEAAGQQYGFAQDFWLAAERHVLTLMRATTIPPGSQRDAHWAQELAALTPQAYLERIRAAAYYAWEHAGRQYGQALHYWLKAEQDALGAMAALAKTASGPGDIPIEKPDALESDASVATNTSPGQA